MRDRGEARPWTWPLEPWRRCSERYVCVRTESKCLQIPFCDTPNSQTRPFSAETCIVLFLEFLTSDTTQSSRLLPKRLPRRRPLPERLLPRRLLSRRFTWRKCWFPGSTFKVSDPWTNACWRGMRGGGLGGSREWRSCKSCGSVLRERSGMIHVLEGRGVGEVGVLVQRLMDAGLSLRDRLLGIVPRSSRGYAVFQRP